MLKIENLAASIKGKKVLEDVNLDISEGGVYALMGRNGSGKTTLAQVIMGNPKYKIESGKIILFKENITNIEASERAKKGLFVSHQNPLEVPGVRVSHFLKTIYNAVNKKKVSLLDFSKILEEKVESVGLGSEFLRRSLNDNFSGGEKKKSEILQMLILNPKVIILDEIDSGLDIDSLKKISKIINHLKDNGKLILIITHYRKILDYIKPDRIFVMDKGKIIKQGKNDILDKIEKEGYDSIL